MEEVRNYINIIRRDFAQKSLNEDVAGDDPIAFFAIWLEEAINAQILDPYAMCVSTVGEDNKPDSRIVYLRDLNEKGFVFYTNYQSKKGSDIRKNPFAALNFLWTEIERQVRINGEIEIFSDEESDLYFKNRPRESKIGAWASAQSTVLESRNALEERVEFFTKKYEGIEDIPRPDFWGGYLVRPETIEFWQGRPSRLHDRIRFRKHKLAWIKERLSP